MDKYYMKIIRCGQYCASSGLCECGDSNLHNYNDMWCCNPPNSTCTRTSNTTVDCPKGKLIHLNQTCNNACNYYDPDPYKLGNDENTRSYKKCPSADLCVPEYDLCPVLGDGRCPDKADDLWLCQYGIQGNSSPFDYMARCTRSLPGQCIDNVKLQDQKSACVGAALASAQTLRDECSDSSRPVLRLFDCGCGCG